MFFSQRAELIYDRGPGIGCGAVFHSGNENSLIVNRTLHWKFKIIEKKFKRSIQSVRPRPFQENVIKDAYSCFMS